MISFLQVNERSVQVSWPQRIDESILWEVLDFELALRNRYAHNIHDIIVAYASILVVYTHSVTISAVEEDLRRVYHAMERGQCRSRTWHLPVCYNSAWGVDLEAMAEAKEMTAAELISLHSARSYRVFFIGFLPGFPYLGHLDEKLWYPRRSMPRKSIPAGSVAIGGQQTGIYPVSSPAGWHIVGNCPVSMFSPQGASPCFMAPGDLIRFTPIAVDTHRMWTVLSQKGLDPSILLNPLES